MWLWLLHQARRMERMEQEEEPMIGFCTVGVLFSIRFNLLLINKQQLSIILIQLNKVTDQWSDSGDNKIHSIVNSYINHSSLYLLGAHVSFCSIKNCCQAYCHLHLEE